MNNMNLNQLGYVALHNGHIYVERHSFVEALLIHDGIIIAIGTNKEILSKVHVLSNNVTLIDCEGRTVLPGINDSHLHLIQTGETLYQVNISGVQSIDEMIDRCIQFMAEYPERCIHGIHALGWNQDYFEGDKRIPNRHDLDRISRDIPIVLERVCGHMLTTNTKAIELMGLHENSPQFPDGEFYFGEDGYPNGVFTENATNYAKYIVPGFTYDERKDILHNVMKYAVSCGITSVQSNDVGTTMQDDAEGFRLFREVYSEGKALIRYTHQTCYNDIDKFKDYLQTEFTLPDYTRDSWLSLGPLKLFKDGSLGARTALMRHEYHDDPGNYGIEWMKDKDMREYCRIAREHDLQVIAHVIGDKAVEDTINCFVEEGFIDGRNLLRHGLVHCQITDRPLVERIAKQDILVLAQPIFLDYDMKIVNSRCGDELSSTSYAFGSLHRLGAHVAYGTDAPVEDLNPFPGIYMAVTRKDMNGDPADGFYPAECVDIYDAIDAYTYESAYVEGKEACKGRLKPGFYADLIILDQNIFTINVDAIKNIKPVLTMVGGKIVYRQQ